MRGTYPFTDVVITASHEVQACGYRAQIRIRRGNGSLPNARFHVISDPGGVRVGSGLATVHALRTLADQARTSTSDLLRNKRILILHSGGDSRRLPAYAAQGKLFLPLPRLDDRGERVSLFDLIVSDFSKVRVGDSGRVVIAAGDLYLNLGCSTLLGADVIGVTCRAKAEVGSRHGVYVMDSNGSVRDFLQKPSLLEARNAGAVAKDGTVAIDTGVLSFSPRAMSAIMRACSSSVENIAKRGDRPFDLYEHVMIAVAGKSSTRDYTNSLGMDQAHRTALRSFRDRLPKLKVSTVSGDTIRFSHVGTTAELLDKLESEFSDSKPTGRVILDSTIARSDLGRTRCVIDASILSRSASLTGRNVLVGIPAELTHRIELPRGLGLVALPIDDSEWCCIAFGDRDDCKTALSSGGTFLNRKFRKIPESAWTLAVWLVGSINESYARIRQLIKGTNPRQFSGESLASIIPRVNHERLLAQRVAAARLARIESPGRYLEGSCWMPAARFFEDARVTGTAHSVTRRLIRFGSLAPSTMKARAFFAASLLSNRSGSSQPGSDKLSNAAFEAVRSSVDQGIRLPILAKNSPVELERIVWATSPARIDLFGGWSDTPPICTDLGGHVVNAAAALNGQYPLQAICRRIPEPFVRLNSIDLGGTIVIRSASDLRGNRALLDWSTLPKAALELTGFMPPEGVSIRKHLADHGGGVDVTVFSALPKGSGMGASSILGAVLIAALLRCSSESPTAARVIELTSALEQRMSTGGGWQDQVGGIVPGVKLLRTRPGDFQIPEISAIPHSNALTNSEGSNRCVLYYTGRTRLAKNILRTVVGDYLARREGIRGIIDRLRSGAPDMADAMAKCDTDRVGHLLGEYWSLKKRIDPGSSDHRIEQLFELAKPHLSGGTLLGAGGGGFALFIAKSESHAAKLRAKLETSPSQASGRLYDMRIDHVGLNVSVL